MSKKTLKEIIDEFINTYLQTDLGKKHLDFYKKDDEDVKKLYNEIKEKRLKGEDTTDLILSYFIPLRRKSVFQPPVKTIDVFYRRKLSDDEKKSIADEFWKFINDMLNSSDDIDKQKQIINKFIENPNSKGLQAGLVSSVLFFLNPKFLIINRKTVDTVAYILNKHHTEIERLYINSKLSDYLDNIDKLKKFHDFLNQKYQFFDDFREFDMFCHWMCTPDLGNYVNDDKGSNGDDPEDDVNEVIEKISQTVDTKELIKYYEKYRDKADKANVIKNIIYNAYCPDFIKKDYLYHIYSNYLSNKKYEKNFKRIENNWDDIIGSLEECINSWRPPRVLFPNDNIDEYDNKFKDILDQLTRYKQVILYGPPGTSKTYYARALARSITNNNERNVEFVQFHPSYSYEDFVEGIFPERNQESGQITLKIEDKIFKRICEKANDNIDEEFVLVIDEINRADLSKVFGEIFTALEYRKEKIRLLYSLDSFTIPSNLYIIGTMNTLDKSTVDLDFALMRRFKFIELNPNLNVLRKILKKNDVNDKLKEKIISVFEQINKLYPLGHAYFKEVKSEEDLISLWEYQLSFVLKEYFGELKKDTYESIRRIYFEGLELEYEVY